VERRSGVEGVPVYATSVIKVLTLKWGELNQDDKKSAKGFFNHRLLLKNHKREKKQKTS